MISVLIPVYNRAVYPLVKELSEQLQKTGYGYEILVFEDGSEEIKAQPNTVLNSLPGVKYMVFKENKGRSAIRNQLARSARFENLIFLDCDSEINHSDFLSRYLRCKESPVVYGGTNYDSDDHLPEHRLHVKFGVSREALDFQSRNKQPWLTFKTNNFWIQKKYMLAFPFDESIQTYGYEDVVLAETLKKAGINILHIDNPVIHKGLESNTTFLQKSRESLKNLATLVRNNKIENTRLTTFYQRWQFIFRLLDVFSLCKVFERAVEKRLKNGIGGLVLFDLWKLVVYHQETKKPA